MASGTDFWSREGVPELGPTDSEGTRLFGGSKHPLAGDPLISSIGPRYQCVPLAQGLGCPFLSKWISAGRVSSTEVTAGFLFWGLTWEDPVVIARKKKLNREEKGI